MPKISSANLTQIGGSHYKTGGEEHWDRQWRLFGPAYFIGCITKYVERYQKKNGVEDLLKAAHFLDKLIELEQDKQDPPTLREVLDEPPGGPTRHYVGQD
jgi:hypothetical protein